MKLDQLCIYAEDAASADRAKETLGLADKKWIIDNVRGKVIVIDIYGDRIIGESEGVLRFNYDLGMEYEILTYTDGPNWHDLHNSVQDAVRMGHVGFHLEDGEEFPDTAGTPLEGKCVQEMLTLEHTNAAVIKAGRRYHYRIYDTVMELGYYTKIIRRIGDGTQYPIEGYDIEPAE